MSFLEPGLLAEQSKRLGPGSNPTAPDEPRRPISRAAVLSTMVAAAVFGFVVALGPGDQRRVSIDLWLIAVSLWAGVGLTRRSLGAAPTDWRRSLPVIRLVWPPDPESTPTPRGVVSLEGSLLASADSARSYHHRIRPRLRAIVANRLRLDQGIDLDTDPERGADALGDLWWLIEADPNGDDRSPSADEIQRLLDRAGTDDDWNP